MTDEEKIRDVQARWSAADAAKDAAGLSALYAAEGKYVSRRGEIVGREAILADLQQRSAVDLLLNRRTLHLFGTPSISISDDIAESECGYVGDGRIGDDRGRLLSSGFFWKLRRDGDDWLLAEVHNRAFGPSGGPATSTLKGRRHVGCCHALHV